MLQSIYYDVLQSIDDRLYKDWAVREVVSAEQLCAALEARLKPRAAKAEEARHPSSKPRASLGIFD